MYAPLCLFMLVSQYCWFFTFFFLYLAWYDTVHVRFLQRGLALLQGVCCMLCSYFICCGFAFLLGNLMEFFLFLLTCIVLFFFVWNNNSTLTYSHPRTYNGGVHSHALHWHNEHLVFNLYRFMCWDFSDLSCEVDAVWNRFIALTLDCCLWIGRRNII